MVFADILHFNLLNLFITIEMKWCDFSILEVYRGWGNIQSCQNFNLMSHTLKNESLDSPLLSFSFHIIFQVKNTQLVVS